MLIVRSTYEEMSFTIVSKQDIQCNQYKEKNIPITHRCRDAYLRQKDTIFRSDKGILHMSFKPLSEPKMIFVLMSVILIKLCTNRTRKLVNEWYMQMFCYRLQCIITDMEIVSFDNIFLTGYTNDSYYDINQCSQWWKCYQMISVPFQWFNTNNGTPICKQK